MTRSSRGHWKWLCRSATMTALMWISPTVVMAAPPPTGTPHSSDLIVSLAQVQAIVGEPTLEAKPDSDRTSPWVDHSQDAKLSMACRHHLNQDEAFGTTWSNFTSTNYSAASNLGVRQTIAVYPNADTARHTFDATKRAARQCHAENPPEVFSPGYTLTELDPTTLLAQYPDSVNGPGSVHIFAQRGQVLVEVGAAHLSTDPRIAQAVLALITTSIPR